MDVDAKNVFDDGWTALHYAVHEGYLEAVKLLVEKYRAQIDTRSTQNKTPFHLACTLSSSPLILYLLSRGASPCVVDRDGSTPLHYLCETGNLEMIKAVLPLAEGTGEVRNRFGLKPVELIRDKAVRREVGKETASRKSSVSKSPQGRTGVMVHKMKEGEKL